MTRNWWTNCPIASLAVWGSCRIPLIDKAPVRPGFGPPIPAGISVACGESLTDIQKRLPFATCPSLPTVTVR